MILSVLTYYYEHLLKEGKVGQEGWSSAKVSYAITLDRDGHVKGVQLLERPVLRGKKEVFVPVERFVPFQKGRSSQVAPYFMCDNAKYLLGAWLPTGDAALDEKNRKQAQAYFKASASYHREILQNCKSPLAQAVLVFFDTWEFEKNKDEINVEWDKLLAASNLIFRSFENGQELLKEDEIHKVWDEYFNRDESGNQGRCLVTGQVAPIARLHPLLKGVRGAQSSGAALVSFNGSAFESYGKEQGDNAPVSEYAAAAYGKALNFLLTDEKHHKVLGDTTMVFFADTEENEDGYARFLLEFSGELEASEEHKLISIMDAIAKGKTCVYDEGELKPDTKFYILGLSPNAARISVRFFYNSTFGNMVSNIKAHYDRLKIVKPVYFTKEYPSIGDILYETVNKKATNKQVQPILVGAFMDAVLQDHRYPAAIFTHMMLRIHAEHEINRNRAAMLKAYIIKNYPEKKEVVDCMKLNEDTVYMPYVLGRLFAVMEDIQKSAIGKETLRDRYFNSASATPGVIFPQLMRLMQSHMRVLSRDNKGLQIKKEKELESLFRKIDTNIPARLSLEDQGIFMIGYYHQVQKFYEKKTDNADQTTNK